MTTPEIKPGKIVYGHDGRQAEYVAETAARHLVRPIATFTTYDGETYDEPTDALELWDKVYPKAPTHVQDEAIKALINQIAELRAERATVEAEIMEGQKETLAMIQRLKRYAPLKNLEEVLDGTITHVVEGHGFVSLEIKDFETAAVYRDDYSRKNVLRMLSLQPNEDGVITWHLNRWNDGSGNDTPVYLCTSLEEAREAAVEIIVRSIANHSYETHPHLWASAEANAAKLGLTIPADIVEKAKAYRVKVAQDTATKAAEALAKAQASLSEVSGNPRPSPMRRHPQSRGE
jgi:hypothetical protein